MVEEFKFFAKPMEDKFVRLEIGEGSELISYDIKSNQGSLLAAAILRASAEAFIASGDKPLDFTTHPASWGVSSTTGVGLGPSQIQNHISLLLRFGATILGIPLEKSILRRLGEGLIAASADESSGH